MCVRTRLLGRSSQLEVRIDVSSYFVGHSVAASCDRTSAGVVTRGADANIRGLPVTKNLLGVSKGIMTQPTLEDLVTQAVAGDASALDSMLRQIKDGIYGLAIRMLWHPADAEDATQEILMRVVTRLSTFEGRSKFRSWVYRLSVRSILNFKRGQAEARSFSFEEFGDDLLQGLESQAPDDLNGTERTILAREVKIACTQAMLLCLDRDHRISYLLGEVLEFSSAEAADCLGVPSATYRKRLSRAREKVNRFTQSHCSLVNETAACSCQGRIAPALRGQRIDAKRLLFAKHPLTQIGKSEAEAVAQTIESVCDGSSLMRSNPAYQAPDRLLEHLGPPAE